MARPARQRLRAGRYKQVERLEAHSHRSARPFSVEALAQIQICEDLVAALGLEAAGLFTIGLDPGNSALGSHSPRQSSGDDFATSVCVRTMDEPIVEPLMPRFALTVNGTRHDIDADPEMPLLWVLRDRLGLLGTKYGCGVGVCGACTVHENGVAVRACQTNIAETVGNTYVTIEGLSPQGTHPCQLAWIEEDVAQCGYCQPGMIMEAAALIRATPTPTNAQIDRVFRDHVCRCGTYARLRRAVMRAAGVAP
jgi:isoquinoline 1-oxidoreductase alpha subunit